MDHRESRVEKKLQAVMIKRETVALLAYSSAAIAMQQLREEPVIIFGILLGS